MSKQRNFAWFLSMLNHSSLNFPLIRRRWVQKNLIPLKKKQKQEKKPHFLNIFKCYKEGRGRTGQGCIKQAPALFILCVVTRCASRTNSLGSVSHRAQGHLLAPVLATISPGWPHHSTSLLHLRTSVLLSSVLLQCFQIKTTIVKFSR